MNDAPASSRDSQALKGPHLSIVIPVRNEGVNLKIMLKILKAVVDISHEVLVVYDSPEDSSIPVVQKLQPAHPHLIGVLNRKGRGVINALLAGVEAARGHYVLIFAADEVGPVMALEEMLELMDGGCEFVSCTRYAHGGRRLGGSPSGRFLSTLANWMFQHLAGCVMSDATTGIKMFRREDFPRFRLEARPVGWAVAFEMAIKAQTLGLKIGEVPIVSVDRLYGGKSTFRLRSWTFEYLRWFVWGMRELRRCPKKMRRADVQVKLPAAFVES